ncbi:MAG: hypothetical protein AAGA99_19330 [Actinomycetota bacterium]
MQRRSAIALLGLLAFVAAACGGDSDDDSADTTPAPEAAAEAGGDDGGAAAPEAGALQVTEVRFENSSATITNTGDEPVNLNGLFMCNRPTYVPLPDQTLAPGETLDVGLAGMTPDGGEFAIYTSQNFSSADDIISYVHWGPGGGRADTAIEAGVWSGDPATAGPDGLTLTGDPGSAGGWG